MEGVAFFDLEVSRQPKGKINSIGACLGGRSWQGTSIHDFETFIQKAAFLCGHNILAHDIPYLEKAGISISFLQHHFIDTLFLSALLFPNKPYHRLVKDYQLMSEHVNNPVEDARLAKRLLIDCLEAFDTLPATMQKMLFGLLHQEKEFTAFFKLPGLKAEPLQEHASLQQDILSYFKGRLCENADISALMKARPIQLAYALALLNAPDSGSVIPPWLLYQYPDLTQVLHQLRAVSCQHPGCHYCRENLSAVAGLRRYFNYPGFRKFSEQEQTPLQQAVVEAAIQGESLLAIFPTGGGKSLAFQLPALMKGEADRGLTVVISPLQALMKDQVDVLRNRFDIIRAVAINGLLSPLERADAIQTVREGGANLLYISPESLRSNTVLSLLKGRFIERFVIDEAHCFSTWGQDFRVDYLYIGKFIKELAAAKRLAAPIPVSCFTATAKPEVVKDIRQYFQQEVKLDLHLYQTSAARKNLTYNASPADSQEVKLQQLQDLLQPVSEPAIVYVSRTRTAEYVAEKLQKVGLKAEAFHGQMEADVKIHKQDSFISGETNVMVATSAFGMGVDKENVKMVIHYDITDSLENYLQEAGRAGRKADLQAQCHLLFDEHDLNEHFALLNRTRLSRKEVGQIWKAIKDFKRTKFTKSALEIARQAGWDTDLHALETQVKAAIAALEDVGYVKRSQNAPRIFAKSILVRNVEAANKIIRANVHRFPEGKEQEAIRIFQYLISRKDTRTDYLADDLGIAKENVIHILLHFKELGLLGDTRDLTAFIHPGSSKNNSQHCFQHYAQIEHALLETLLPSDHAPVALQRCLRDINEAMVNAGNENCSLEAIRTLLQFWEHRHYIRKERLDAPTMLYRIVFRQNRATLLGWIRQRQDLARGVVAWLCAENDRLISHQQKRAEAALAFSMLEMKQQLESNAMFIPKTSLVDYEAVLLYLHFIGAVKLEGGLFVLYNPMTIERLEKNPLKQYTRDDYAKLERYYEKKAEQIHIMGEYARKQLSNHLEALHFVDDYFTLSYEAFIQRHFRGKKGMLKRPVTEKKFKEVFGTLSEEQLEVVKDQESRHILVGAGPGSGKTRVLVHKVASLLMMEDIKPDQFLMLTFSRPAAMEFKDRLKKLIGKAAYHIDIFTYYGFAFQLLGRVGDLKKSEHVIQQTMDAVRQEDIPVDRIKSKSVIVVDEYQDINQQEYDFLKMIIALADEVRVMVVGDDDQNIYEFRGSSVAFMRNFQREWQAKQYLLNKNYRASANLLAFSNQFLSLFNSDRLKADSPLVAHHQTNGTIQITYHPPASDLLIPLVKNLADRQLKGTTAVLTHTNEEAWLVQHQLQQHGIPARLMATQDGFSLRQLLELKCFSWYLREEVSHELGFIPHSSWVKCRERIDREFALSTNLGLVLEVIRSFEQGTGARRFWSDWQAYMQEVRAEDFYYPETDKVLVSTMHKAKGKEFDHVFLLLHDFPLSSEARKRVVYVAITRARQSLLIHTDQTYFNQKSVPKLQTVEDATVYAAPEALQLELGMDEVWLSFFRRSNTVKLVKPLLAGLPLILRQGPAVGLTTKQGAYVVRFSQKFKERLLRLTTQGYRCTHAEIAHIVVWYYEEDGKEYRVVLPRLLLSRSASG